ncbi:MAG TPA: hypothetical protein VLE53_05855 [Gemmatimonadaceae bacterium]|nr:hypothetical protein [Gemmatimonadaceae bacterium]
MRGMLSSWPVVAWLAANAIVLLWNIQIATRIVQTRRGTPVFLALTALAVLLVFPAALVAVAASTQMSGRAVHVIEWVWPFTLLLCTMQAILATVRHADAPLMGLPLAALNALLLGAGVARYVTTLDPDPSAALSALGGAHAGVVALALGREALASPLALQLPVFAPSFRARHRSARVFRALLTAWAAVTVLLFGGAYPRAWHAAASHAPFGAERLQERPAADLAMGVRILPTVAGPPLPAVLREDLALVDSIGSAAIALVIEPQAATRGVLDALARSLEERRRDSTLLIVSVGYGPVDRRLQREDSAAYLRLRLAAVEEITRQLRPDLLFPALDPGTAGVRALGDLPTRWWQAYLREAAVTAHRVRPRTQVGVSVSSFSSRDSALYAWATLRDAPLDVIGLSFLPSYGGGAALRARLRVSEQWMRGATKPHWIFASGSYPRLWGERNQERALWGTLAWTTRQRPARGFIVEGAADYDVLNGLRAPGGRLRPAVGALARAREELLPR